MINRSDYEKITDEVMRIAPNVNLRMNVVLNYYTGENKRTNYHSEIEYYSNKVNANVVNIRRTFDYFLTIENVYTKGDYIRIGINDIVKLRLALHQAYKFFTDPKYKNLYAKKDGEIFLMMNPDPVIITGLTMDKYLKFEPSLFTNFRGEAERSLRMYLSSESSFCDIPVNRLDGFINIIDSINLFQSAQLMLNYIERPEFGTNLYTHNTEPDAEQDANFHGKDGRKVEPQKGNVSYFDRMKGLE